MANVFSLVFKSEKRIRNSSPSHGIKTISFTALLQDKALSLSCHVIIRTLDSMGILQSMTLVHHMDGIMLIRQNEREGASMLATSEGDTHSRAWEILATLKARPFTEDFRGPGAKGVLGHLLPSKLLHIFYHEGSTMPSRLPQDRSDR